ncbi:glycosyl hydrolase family 57 [Imhoffiella purpurea]|uniref:Aldehyde decarbonylase n=1 Tax=Imhoffiella purpurea TaxID=1249627 RepID=W9V5B6_9GAMM|nr:glycosyl hydrolase family 57 [Imhoffiella purpurea]EXJ14524.1 Aldehyde decarbonylase [Imhoffiella purpurea]
MNQLSEYVGDVPNVSGHEAEVATVVEGGRARALFAERGGVDFGSIRAACAIALHQHQPLIPAGGEDLRTAALISNLQYMMHNQHIGDNYNAPAFVWCYKRMGEFIPQLVGEGKSPRCMLEYSGTLLHGLRKMGEDHVIDALKTITCNPDYNWAVEWLGMPWGHAVAPSTPVQDYRLHVRAFQQHFAALFGWEALERVRGFSPSEMALPNHPDVAYEYVKTLVDCGYQWVLVQEHTVQQIDNGRHPERPHLPHRLVCTNSHGESVSIIAIVKTQGSDTKLVAQMQPWYEAQGLERLELAGKSVPPLVTQIADGENGGVMMNEFPGKFMEVAAAASHSATPLMNVSEYLEHLFALGVEVSDLPEVQPLFQDRIWSRIQPGDGPEKLARTIEDLKQEDGRFHMDGGSWTSDLSWVEGYDNVLGPMEEASALFSEKVLTPGTATGDERYRNALFHLMASQTSCYRYWGQGLWTDYGREICRRVVDIIQHDFA